MNVHRAADDRPGRLRVHHVEDRVNDLVAAGAEDRGAQDGAVLGIDRDLHESLRLALLDRACDARHRPLADERLAPALANLGLRHPCPTERRIRVQRVRGDPIAHPAWIVLQQVRDDDLAVVVRGVGERALAVAVAERPDPRNARAELVVDDDVASLVDGDACLVEAEIIGVRTAADGEQHVRTLHVRRAIGAVDAGGDLAAALGEADALRVQADLDALVLDDLADRGRNVFVLAADEPRPHFDNRHLGAETAKHLAEFEADVASADDDQVLRQEVDRHHRAVREEIDRADPGHVGNERAAADIDEDLLGAEALSTDAHLVRGFEAGVAPIDGAVLHVLEPVFQTDPRLLGDLILACLHALHVDTHGADVDAVLGGASGHARRVRARHHRLGRNAAGVDAGSAEDLALDERDLHPSSGETRGHVRAGLAGPDDDRVVARGLHAQSGSFAPDCSATMYAAYHSGQFSSLLPSLASCAPWACSARLNALARSLCDANVVVAGSIRPSSRFVTS